MAEQDRVPSQERTWKDYVRHDDKCASWKCASCGGPSDLLTHNYGAIGGRQPDHDPILQPCDCGLDDLLASPCQQGQGWRTIESAPKDGEIVLLSWPYWSRRATIGYYKHSEWVAENAISDGHEYPGPTHWMPLPDPPVSDPLPAGEQ